MRISDRQLRPIAERVAQTSTKLVDDGLVIEILAAVADRSGRSAAKALTDLQKPGITRTEQLATAKAGLSAGEKKDVEAILDQSGFGFSKGAKNFLEALVGRAQLEVGGGGGPLPPPPAGVTADAQGIRGTLEAGMVIEAINLSSAPDQRLHLTDTKEIGRADAQGQFTLDKNSVTGTDAMQRLTAGDVIRLRGRRADGTTSDWIELKVGGRDLTNAQFNPVRLTLTDDGVGRVGLTHNTARPLTEPGAKLRFINLRTGDQLDATATKDGSIPANLRLPGKAGDQIGVAVSDGTNNADLKTLTTTLTVLGNSGAVDPADDPLPHKDELKADGTPMYPLRRYTGPLFVNGPQSSDVRQGAIGNCYFPAAVAAVAHQMPKLIEDAITEMRNPQTGEREFQVRFYSPSGRMEMVTVDADLYTRSWGGPYYGTTPNATDTDKMELWFPVLEKAYAKWKGSYDKIGNGGSPASVLTALTGKSTRYFDTGYDSADAIFTAVKDAGLAKVPMTAGTHDDKKLYTNTGVYGDHAYSVLGAEESGGKKFILLRNPWGESEAGNDGKNDGYFKLEVATFMKLYSDVSISR
jgi:hypothetical protein